MVHEILQAICPVCSQDEPIPHRILKEKPDLLIKCMQCNAVHSHSMEKMETRSIRVVVSTGDISESRRLTLDSNDIISKGDEFVVENDSTGEANFVLVTSIESGGKRVDSARANGIQTVWARSTDRVRAKVSVTKGWQTESIHMDVPGDQQFTVGEIVSSGDHGFIIKKIKIKDGKFLKKEGQSAQAKYIKRIFADSMERVEWLNRPKRTFRKSARRTGSRGSIIKSRGLARWISKKKGGD